MYKHSPLLVAIDLKYPYTAPDFYLKGVRKHIGGTHSVFLDLQSVVLYKITIGSFWHSGLKDIPSDISLFDSPPTSKYEYKEPV